MSFPTRDRRRILDLSTLLFTEGTAFYFPDDAVLIKVAGCRQQTPKPSVFQQTQAVLMLPNIIYSFVRGRN